MKKLFRLIPLAALCMMLTSCFDYVQSISFKDGKYHLYYKVTMSKALFAMAEQDPEEVLKGWDDSFPKDLPEECVVNQVDTDAEIGKEIIIEVDPEAIKDKEEAKELFPTIKGNKVYMPFLMGSTDALEKPSGMDSEYEQIAMAMLSSVKCRIVIGKNVVTSISEAYFEGDDGERCDVPFYDYGDVFCLEIPFVTLYGLEGIKTNRIVIER